MAYYKEALKEVYIHYYEKKYIFGYDLEKEEFSHYYIHLEKQQIKRYKNNILIDIYY